MGGAVVFVLLTQAANPAYLDMPGALLDHYEAGAMVPVYDPLGNRLDVFTRDEGAS